MEAGESPEEGVAREVAEETGLQAESLELISVHEFLRMNQVIIAFHVRASGQVRLSPELLEYRLLEPEKVQARSEEHTSELQSPCNLVCRLLLEKRQLIIQEF